MKSRLAHVWLALAGLLLALSPAAAREPEHWVGSWSSAQLAPAPRDALPDDQFRNATLRQVVRLTLGGERLRVRLSNAFGTAPLRIGAVHVGLSAGEARIAEGTGRAVTFSGRHEVVIPAGADYLSDPVDLAVPALASVAVSLHLPEPPAGQTSHPGARIDSWLLAGDHVAAPDLPGATAVARWYQLAAIDVEAEPLASAIVILGDSITDGFGVTGGQNNRWPDIFANRLQADPGTRHLAVLNHGIGGGRVLLDGIGPNALARLDREVLSQAGIGHLILLVGVNDLGTLTRDAPATADAHAALVRDVTAAYGQIVMRARERGIQVIGGTILPYGASPYYHPGLQNEANRQAINSWIRTPGNFDAVIDFDAVTRDPARPDRMRADVDSGDGLHPSIAGYRIMAEAVPLGLFVR